jgi:hypothetical protein
MATSAEQRAVLHRCIAQLSSAPRQDGSTLNGPTSNDLAGTMAAQAAETQRLQQVGWGLWGAHGQQQTASKGCTGRCVVHALAALCHSHLQRSGPTAATPSQMSNVLQSMLGAVLSQEEASTVNNSNSRGGGGAAAASPPAALACNANSQQRAPHSTAAAAGQQDTGAARPPGHWLDLTFPASPCTSGDQQPLAAAPAPAPAKPSTRSKASSSPRSRRPAAAAAQHGSSQKRQVLEAFGDAAGNGVSSHSSPQPDSLLAPEVFAARPALKKLRVCSSTHKKPQAQAGTQCSPRASLQHGQSQLAPQGVVASGPEAEAAEVLMELMGAWSQKKGQQQRQQGHQLQQLARATASPAVKPGPAPVAPAAALAAQHSSHAGQHSTAAAAMPPPPLQQQQQQRPGDFNAALMTAFMTGYAQRMAEERAGGGGAAAMPGWSPLPGGAFNGQPQSPLMMAGGSQVSAPLQQHHQPATAHSPSGGGHHSPAAPAPSTPGSDGKHVSQPTLAAG